MKKISGLCDIPYKKNNNKSNNFNNTDLCHALINCIFSDTDLNI